MIRNDGDDRCIYKHGYAEQVRSTPVGHPSSFAGRTEQVVSTPVAPGRSLIPHAYAEQVAIHAPEEQPSSSASRRELVTPQSIISHGYAKLRILILGMMAILLSQKEIQSHPYLNDADEAWKSLKLTTFALLHSRGWTTWPEGSVANPGVIAQRYLSPDAEQASSNM